MQTYDGLYLRRVLPTLLGLTLIGGAGFAPVLAQHRDCNRDNNDVSSAEALPDPMPMSYPFAAPGSLNMYHWKDYTGKDLVSGSVEDQRYDNEKQRAESLHNDLMQSAQDSTPSQSSDTYFHESSYDNTATPEDQTLSYTALIWNSNPDSMAQNADDVYILRGNTLYQLRVSDLSLVNQRQLPAPNTQRVSRLHRTLPDETLPDETMPDETMPEEDLNGTYPGQNGSSSTEEDLNNNSSQNGTSSNEKLNSEQQHSTLDQELYGIPSPSSLNSSSDLNNTSSDEDMNNTPDNTSSSNDNVEETPNGNALPDQDMSNDQNERLYGTPPVNGDLNSDQNSTSQNEDKIDNPDQDLNSDFNNLRGNPPSNGKLNSTGQSDWNTDAPNVPGNIP